MTIACNPRLTVYLPITQQTIASLDQFVATQLDSTFSAINFSYIIIISVLIISMHYTPYTLLHFEELYQKVYSISPFARGCEFRQH